MKLLPQQHTIPVSVLMVEATVQQHATRHMEQISTAQKVLDLKNADNLVTGTNQHVRSAVSDNPPHLFQIGQASLVDGHVEAYKVTIVEIDAQRIKLTIGAELVSSGQ